MCVQTIEPTTARPKQVTATKAAPRRVCQWTYDPAHTLRLLEDKTPAPLMVTVGENSWLYFVVLEDDGTYTMQHAWQDNSGADEYSVNLERGTCTCPHFEHRHECKKHVPALRAALAWLEARQ